MQVGDQITASQVTLAVQEQQQVNSCPEGFGYSEGRQGNLHFSWYWFYFVN